MNTSHSFWNIVCLGVLLTVIPSINSFDENRGIDRSACYDIRTKTAEQITEHRRRLHRLRELMLTRSTLQGPIIHAYIITSYDEHLNEDVDDHDKRLHYLTGFTGLNSVAAITLDRAAFWVNDPFLHQANAEIDCEWDLFPMSGNTDITDWLEVHVLNGTRIGADPHVVPHYMWRKWEIELKNKLLTLVPITTNLIDLIWDKRPHKPNSTVIVLGKEYSGEEYRSKIVTLRNILRSYSCDAMIVTSLTDIAYILNIRSRDIPYVPVVKGYLIVTHRDINIYTDVGRLIGVSDDFRTTCYNPFCITVKPYEYIWNDIRTELQAWKRVLVPAPCVFDKGASEAIYLALRDDVIFEKISPIVFMKARKNEVEREGMQIAHIKDGAAMCEALSNLEERFFQDTWTELKVRYEVKISRTSKENSKGLSLPIVVAFGSHSSNPHYIPTEVTDIPVTDKGILIIESGGQYLEGTTDVIRTFHFGEPTLEQKRAYTRVLAGIIALSRLKFPPNLTSSDVDILPRSHVWVQMNDYPHGTGHGIGSYLSVKESPINVPFTNGEKFTFKEGYFWSSEPGYYKKGSYGIRLGNVLEVVNTHHWHPSQGRFLAFREVTLVPYEPKFIDGTLLSAEDKRWLNNYNARIRNLVGAELKRQNNMRAFYWMMNKTRHIREYLTEEEYLKASGGSRGILTGVVFLFTFCFQFILLFS